MAKRQKTKRQTIVHKKLKTEPQEPHQKPGGKLRCSGRWGLPSPLVAHVVFLKLTIRLPEDMQQVLYCGIETLRVIIFFFLFSFSFIQGNLRLYRKEWYNWKGCNIWLNCNRAPVILKFHRGFLELINEWLSSIHTFWIREKVALRFYFIFG